MNPDDGDSAGYLDNYCERLDGSFWSEPLNAVSNLAFALAAIAVWLLIEQASRSSGRTAGRWQVRTLAVIIFLIFLGSGAFHTTATRWGAIADTGFIAVYLVYYIVLFAGLFWGVPWRFAWLAAPVFVGFTALVALGANAVGVGGPGMYLAALIALIGLGGSLHFSRQPQLKPYGVRFVGIGLLFAVSLTFRTLDDPLCESLPIGTHFLWHIFNAVVLYLTAHLAVRRWAQREGIGNTNG